MARRSKTARSAGTKPWPKLQTASWQGRGVEERARAIESACRTAMQLLADAPDRTERLARIDPVPPSTRAHLRRLAAGR